MLMIILNRVRSKSLCVKNGNGNTFISGFFNYIWRSKLDYKLSPHPFWKILNTSSDTRSPVYYYTRGTHDARCSCAVGSGERSSSVVVATVVNLHSWSATATHAWFIRSICINIIHNIDSYLPDAFSRPRGRHVRSAASDGVPIMIIVYIRASRRLYCTHTHVLGVYRVQMRVWVGKCSMCLEHSVLVKKMFWPSNDYRSIRV